MMKNELTGKCVVITGASSGAGRAAAEQFAMAGANVVLASRNEDALQVVAEECRNLGAEALVVPTDVCDPRAMITLANQANAWKGKIDVWVNNAGVLAAGEFDTVPMAVHKQVIETNLIGYMNGAHAVLPIFKAQGYGTLINNISIGGFLPVPHGGGYSASKFGLRGWSEALKGELSAWPNIIVCDLFPAFLDTPGITHAANYTGKALKPAPPVYDPQRLALEMVRLAIHPRANKYVGSASILLKAAHALFPEMTTKITASVMRSYFGVASDIPHTDGNVFNTVDHAMSAHGGFGLPGEPKAHRKFIGTALLAGLGIGLLLIDRKEKK